MAQTRSVNDLKRFQGLLEVRIADWRKRRANAMEASPDQRDETQRAPERALAL